MFNRLFKKFKRKEARDMQSLVVSLGPVHGPKSENEDAYALDRSAGIFIVADGVTRTPGEDGIYPVPSPGRAAAVDASGATLQALLRMKETTGESLQQAIAAGNEAVREVNEEKGFWEHCNWLDKDLAGAVLSCAVVHGQNLRYAFIGDCGVAKVRRKGEVVWHTPNEVDRARSVFPKTEDVGKEERTIRVRRDFRNKPFAAHPTYGVLTGENEALHYVTTGNQPLRSDEAVIVYSDGMIPLIFEDDRFRKLLFSASQEQLQEYVFSATKQLVLHDEKTLIVHRPSN